MANLGFGQLGGYFGDIGGQLGTAFSKSLSGQVDNPYLQQQTDAMRAQSNQNLNQQVLPGIGQGATAAGQYGGSRQGIAQGVAIGNAETGLNNAIAGLYGNAYESAQNRMGQAAGQLGQIGASMYGSDQQLAGSQAQAAATTSAASIRAAADQAINEANNKRMGAMDAFTMQNQGALTADQLQTNAINKSLILPTWQQDSLVKAGNLYSQMGGQGGTQSTPYSSNPLGNVVGGALTGLGLYNQFNNPQPTTYGNYGMRNLGTTSGGGF